MNQVTFPSIVAPGDTDSATLTLGQYNRGRHQDKPHVVNWGDGPYLVGSHVGNYAEATERQDFNRLSEGAEAKALYYTALGLLMGTGSHNIRGITVGLPVDVITNKPLADATMKRISGILRGEHFFVLDGNEVTINVQSIARCAQPVGAFTSWMVRNKRLPDGEMWGVADGGFNTLDIFGVRYPKIVHKYTAGYNHGMSVACKAYKEDFKRITGRSISLHEADHYLRNGSQMMVEFMGKSFNLETAKQQALSDLASKVLTDIRTKWGEMLPFKGIIFAGGQFKALHHYVVNRFGGSFIVDNPVMAIAEGLYYQSTFTKEWKDGKTFIGLDPGYWGIKAVSN